ncbi:MAG: hypothetical protein U0525_02520 [Patescibacteria group bacterium]
MSVVTFVTPYEGPKKIFFIENEFEYPLIGILSTLGDNVSEDKCELALHNIEKAIKDSDDVHDVFAFRDVIFKNVKGLDGAFVYVKNSFVYCVTIGTGMVFLRRNGMVKQIVDSGSLAKGSVKVGDEFVVTSSEYLDFVGGLDGFKYYFGRYKASEVSEMMGTYDDQSSPSGFAALHIGQIEEDEDILKASVADEVREKEENQHAQIQVDEEVKVTDEEDGELIDDKVTVDTDFSSDDDSAPTDAKTKKAFAVKLPDTKDLFSRQNIHKIKNLPKVVGTGIAKLKELGVKKIAISLVIIVGLILMVRMIPFGMLFRNRDADYAKLEMKVEEYLKEADTQSFEDMQEVPVTLEKARSEIEVLPDVDKKYFALKIKELEKKIDDKELELLKITKSDPKEYYSLDLLGKNVSISDVDIDENSVYLLDNSSGAVYIIPTDKISQKIIKSDKLRGAIAIASYEGRTYVLTKTDGVYLIEENKSTQVLKADKIWDQIVDMKVYASNIYLLDAGSGNIYKYPGISEKSFGDKVDYLVEESKGTLTDAKSMFISGPVYVIGKSKVAKFVTGRRDEIVLRLPYTDSEISSFTTLPENKGFYIYDKEYSAIYAFGEDGIFSQQFKNDKFAKGVAIVSNENGIFMITNTSIYALGKE